MTFETLRHLTALDISWKKDLKFDSMENLTNGLNNTSIKFLNFNGLQEKRHLDFMHNIKGRSSQISD